MSTFIPANYGSLAYEYTGTAGTAPYIVTCGIALPGGAPLQDVVDFAFDAWADRWIPNTFTDFTLERCTLTVNAPGGGYGSIVSSQPAQAGEASGTPGLVAVAVLINKRTGLLGRKGRGRMFIPGLLGEPDIDVDGILPPSTLAIYDDLAGAWLAAMQAGDDDWDTAPNPVVLHSDASLAPAAITSMVTSPKVGILRKRLR